MDRREAKTSVKEEAERAFNARGKMLADIHWCSYSPVLRDWLSNSWRSWSSNSVRRELGAGTIPR
jgi:hypothetical protein